ncbi:TBC1 domain family member 10B [Acipenser ruthenus]|uniref:TBC1 domain family member 10B n=1 Tax=Acipenser ruthenus TaxID=7906 RepID=A0A444V7M6_ACIRT|nr:TBC1 domain family member 10B [Acipenser ruthenus]
MADIFTASPVATQPAGSGPALTGTGTSTRTPPPLPTGPKPSLVSLSPSKQQPANQNSRPPVAPKSTLYSSPAMLAAQPPRDTEGRPLTAATATEAACTEPRTEKDPEADKSTEQARNGQPAPEPEPEPEPEPVKVTPMPEPRFPPPSLRMDPALAGSGPALTGTGTSTRTPPPLPTGPKPSLVSLSPSKQQPANQNSRPPVAPKSTLYSSPAMLAAQPPRDTEGRPLTAATATEAACTEPRTEKDPEADKSTEQARNGQPAPEPEPEPEPEPVKVTPMPEPRFPPPSLRMDPALGSVSSLLGPASSKLSSSVSLLPGYLGGRKPMAADSMSCHLDSVSMMSGTQESLAGFGLGDDASSMGSDSEINGMTFRKTDKYGFLGGTHLEAGQQDLYRILKAYTVYRPEEGYCQAQAPVAAVLLMHMPAEQAFWCLVQVCEKYLPGYYSAGLKSCTWVKIIFRVGLVLLRQILGSMDKLRDCQGMYETMEKLRSIPPEYMREERLVQEKAKEEHKREKERAKEAKEKEKQQKERERLDKEREKRQAKERAREEAKEKRKQGKRKEGKEEEGGGGGKGGEKIENGAQAQAGGSKDGPEKGPQAATADPSSEGPPAASSKQSGSGTMQDTYF